MDQQLAGLWYTLRAWRRHWRDMRRQGVSEWDALDAWCERIGVVRVVGEREYHAMRRDIIKWLSEPPIGTLWSRYKDRKEIAI